MECKNIPIKGLVYGCDKKELKIRDDLKGQISHVLISSSCLRDRIHALAEEIIRDAKHKETAELQVIVVLKGAATFASMLAQEIYKAGGPPVRLNYIKASSYGRDITSSGSVRIEGQLPYIKGKDVLIVEDIIDTGLTLSRLKEYLIHERRASSVKICALLDKKARRLPELKQKLKTDYVGFRVPDIFVAGYGIDCAEHFRELPYVVAVKEDYFTKKGKEKRIKDK